MTMIPDRPDNRAGWDAVSAVYQERLGWPSDRLAWGVRCPFEDELRLLGDVKGLSVVVLGCGGGQDIAALAKMGAARITGVDISDRQLEHARDFLLDEDVLSSTRLVHGSVEDLRVIDDESVDIAVSIHTLNYVEHAALCFAETRRVLRANGIFAFSVQHPADAATHDLPPFGFEKPYFQVESEWPWTGLAEGDTRFRSYYRTVADWFDLLRNARFTIERILEPRPSEDSAWLETGWGQRDDFEKYATVPGTLIFVARKTGDSDAA
ncbi:MAG: class I SAM-dependent methyltransferase [Chloroflexi bacterium]|nr:class I SAM-dependent methyltransferase [Chloroflexota bacterium]